MTDALPPEIRDLVAVIGVIAGLLSFQGAAAADTFSDSGFATERIATVPPYTLVGMAFAPDGRLFVWQKNGVVRVIKNGQLLPTPFIDLSAKVNTFDDRGFWGLAFDPQFASNGRVYMSYTFESGGDPNSSAPRTARLTRVTADPANPDVALPGSEVTILGSVGTPPCSAYPASADCIGADGGSHTLGSLHFASDGTLFVGVGDGIRRRCRTRCAPRTWTARTGRSCASIPTASAPSDNPFYDGTNSWRSRVWLYGVRNPFGFTIQPGDRARSTSATSAGTPGRRSTTDPRRRTSAGRATRGTGPQPFFQGNSAQCGALPPAR